MNDFIRKYQDQLNGTLSGFDRLVFRGTLWKDQLTGMKGYLWAHHLGARDFGSHVEQISKRVKEAFLAPLQAVGRPVRSWHRAKRTSDKSPCGLPEKTVSWRVLFARSPQWNCAAAMP